MAKVGFIAPVKFPRSVLQNAASVTGLLLTIERATPDLPEKEKPTRGGVTDY